MTGRVVELTFPGRPVPAARPRVTRHGSRTYDPRAGESRALRRLASQQLPGSGFDPLSGPLLAEMAFVFPRPKSLKGSGWKPHVVTPDTDNLVKFLLDSLNGVVYEDDRTITRLTAAKWYAPDRETEAYTWLRVTES